MNFSKNSVNIRCLIVVDRENLKKILVGKNGSMIKEIGIRSRKDIEPLLGKNVYLELFVKVIPKWRDREKFLNEIGFKEFNFDYEITDDEEWTTVQQLLKKIANANNE